MRGSEPYFSDSSREVLDEKLAQVVQRVQLAGLLRADRERERQSGGKQSLNGLGGSRARR